MAMSRFLGGTSFTTRPSTRISPEVTVSSPAIMRSTVDLPQPDGPTRPTHSPSAMTADMPRITGVAPKLLWTLRISTVAMIRSDPGGKVAAVPVDHRPGDETLARRGEIERGAGELADFAEAAHGRARKRALLALGRHL